MNIVTEQRDIMADERALIGRAQNGDGDAFLHLYRQHAAHMYGTCLRILANEAQAKDAAQQALIDAWQHLSAFRFESPFSAWIHRIAVRAALGLIRTEKRRNEQRLGRTPHFSDGDDGDDGGSELLTEHSMRNAMDAPGDAIDLEHAIALLAPRMRSVLVLHDIEGYRHEEIGSLLNIAPGTSKAHLHRARTLVKEWLQQ